jgi:hypothetical protein
VNKTSIAVAFVMLLMIPSLLFAECLNYEPELVLLTGKIIRKTFPGRPNYESIKDGDEPETYWILVLAKPLCVNGKKDKDGKQLYYPELNTKQVQLVFMGNEYQTHKNLVGRNVIVRGSLFPMQTGHHHTNVLIQVKEMRENEK